MRTQTRLLIGQSDGPAPAAGRWRWRRNCQGFFSLRAFDTSTKKGMKIKKNLDRTSNRRRTPREKKNVLFVVFFIF